MLDLSVFSWRSLRLGGSNAFAFWAAALHKLHSGGHTRAIRGICANSAPCSRTSADTKCQFSAALPYIRQSFQRMYCEICEYCESCA